MLFHLELTTYPVVGLFHRVSGVGWCSRAPTVAFGKPQAFAVVRSHSRLVSGVVLSGVQTPAFGESWHRTPTFDESVLWKVLSTRRPDKTLWVLLSITFGVAKIIPTTVGGSLREERRRNSRDGEEARAIGLPRSLLPTSSRTRLSHTRAGSKWKGHRHGVPEPLQFLGYLERLFVYPPAVLPVDIPVEAFLRNNTTGQHGEPEI